MSPVGTKRRLQGQQKWGLWTVEVRQYVERGQPSQSCLAEAHVTADDDCLHLSSSEGSIVTTARTSATASMTSLAPVAAAAATFTAFSASAASGCC